jgi:hypothetical protein
VTFTPRAAVLWGLGSYDDPDLTFQGIDDFGVEWVLGMPDGWKRTSAETPVLEGGGDGGWAGTVRRRVKPLTLRGAFRSCRADADLDAAEDRLRAALENYTTTDTLLWRGGAQPVQMGVRLSGDLDVDEYRNRQVRTFTAVVTADDPYKYAAGAAGLLAVSIAAPTTTRAGVTFPVDFSHGGVDFGGGAGSTGRVTVINPGLPTWPVVTFTTPTDTLDTPTLRHVGLGQSEGLARLLYANDRAVFDNRARTVRLNDVSVFGQRIPGNAFFQLQTGANDLYFSAKVYNSAATVTVAYRPRWS